MPPLNPYPQLARDFAALLESGRDFPLGNLPFPDYSAPAEGAPVVLIFSPHPDDEVIIGAWPFRLARERGWRVVNVAVTQGSRKDRQAARLEELRACCRYAGFELATLGSSGLEGLHLGNRAGNPAHWNAAVSEILAVLKRYGPSAVLFPHETDRNTTHVGVHFLLMDALQRMEDTFSCAVIETEFWGAMDTPNVMLEVSPGDLGVLLSALSFHEGEVRRNPYHLRTAAWMIDNVRRGGELVGKQGAAPPDFAYATLYRLRRWQAGRLQPALREGLFLSRHDDVEAPLRAVLAGSSP
ncbi:MAG: PIG-L family deacetylase [Verrucomicrobia bacterium]|nr:PIG-L family deacetylase [Verrucomicrobiota bacterium]